MTKLEIFDEVVDIMRHDSSTCKDITGGNVDEYRVKIKEEMSDFDFLYAIQSYLATFGIKGHINFYQTNSNQSLNFKVQRYHDALYVTDVAKNTSLKKGNKIVEVDGIPVKDFALQHVEFMYGEVEERQAYGWQRLLKFCKSVTVETEDGTLTMPVKLDGEWEEKERYFCKELVENVLYMRLADFDDEESIQNMYAANEELLVKSRYFVIDVRGNSGGSISCFFPLMKYCLPVGKTINELGLKLSNVETNYTERNCNSRLELIEQYRLMELPEETAKMLDAMETELEKYKGKGFIEDSQDMELPIVGEDGVEHVYIITDENCASSGDAFVEIMSVSPKVTIVGRPTMGIQDYSSICEVSLGDFSFVYPTTRLTAIDDGIMQTKNGVAVDVYVPWTPDFLTCDVDLETVMDLIKKKEQEKEGL